MTQLEICEKKHGIKRRRNEDGNYIRGCMKDGKTIFPGPGCKNAYGTCKFIETKEEE